MNRLVPKMKHSSVIHTCEHDCYHCLYKLWIVFMQICFSYHSTGTVTTFVWQMHGYLPYYADVRM